MGSVPYFQILCFAGIAICLQSVNYYAVAAIGKSKELLKWTIVKRVLGLFFVVVGLKMFGIYGLLIGMVVTSWLIFFINAAVAAKYVGYALRNQFKDLSPIFTLSFLSFSVAYSLTWLSINNLYIDAIAKFVLFVSTYIIISYTFQMRALRSAKDSLSFLIKKVKR